ncbi:MAG: FAD-dependent monooxygenase, partial [Venatoribacter sp.]
RLGKLTKVGVRASYPLSLVKAQEQVRRSLVLLGNAAHGLHPVAGQGFNLSLRDTAVLAEHLNTAIAQGKTPGDLDTLMAYAAQQQADQRNTTLLSDLLPRLFGFENKGMILMRNAGLTAMSFMPTVRKLFARHAMGLGHRAAKIL